MNRQKLFIFINAVVAYLWIIFLYLINNGIYLINFNVQNDNLIAFINILIYFSVILSGSFMAYLWIKMINSKIVENNLNGLKRVVPVYKEYLPVFLSMVIISLSLKDNYNYQIAICIFLFLFVIFYMSKIAFLNPVLYLFGFRVYKLETDKTEYILISNEKDYKNILNKNLKIKKLDEEVLIYIKEGK